MTTQHFLKSRMPHSLSESSRGLISLGLAQFMWGTLPLFWLLLADTDASKAVGYRIVSSFFFALALAFLMGQWVPFRKIFDDTKSLKIATLAGLIITVNWCLYVYAVLSGHILEAALGLFLTPLLTVIAGVVFLREKLRSWQWVSVGLGGIAVVVVAAGYGRFPWLAVGIAIAVAIYSLLKKHLGYPPMAGLAIETALPAIGAIGFIAVTQLHSVIPLDRPSLTETALLIASGVVTTVPLAFLAHALQRVPLTTVGIAQYLNPILQFIVGLFVAHEAVGATKWAGFVLVWIALATFTAESIRHQRRNMRSYEAEIMPEPV